MSRNVRCLIDNFKFMDNNVITLIKRLIKVKTQGGRKYVAAGYDKTGRNSFQGGAGSGDKG